MQQVQIKPNRTYATRERAAAAAEKIFGDTQLRYFILPVEVLVCGTTPAVRYAPVFVGRDEVLQAGVHFHFCCIG